ncbi:MAG: hypothetical protein K6C11_01820 [Bacilli bacterium]|nr:hypothetical protein [Bacilli bacterium]
MFKKKYFSTIFLLLCMIIPAYSSALQIEMTGTDVSIRTGPGTNHGTYGYTKALGELYTLKQQDLVKTEKGCNSGYWYKIDYQGKDAYICSSYAIIKNDQPIVITDEAKNQCEAELKAAGFPVSYWTSLCNLKIQHPTWTFQSVYTGYDFAAAVSLEQCKGSISTSSRGDYQDTTCGKTYDSGYTGASQTATAYYMNPINFLGEDTVFQFESGFINNGVKPYYPQLATKLSNSKLVANIPELPNYIANASQASQASATFLAARIKQEIGSGILSAGKAYAGELQSALNGNYTDRFGYYYSPTTGWDKNPAGRSSVNNYYNFYNIGATDGNGITQKALAYAFKQGWGGPGLSMSDARQKAVTGGADWIYRNYINAGQETFYFNKFNFNPVTTKNNHSIASHQYMTNIDAPLSEGRILYSAYKNLGLLNLPFHFVIPVYGNLNASIDNSSGGATGDTTNENTSLAPSTMMISAGFKVDGQVIRDLHHNTGISDIVGRITSQGGSAEVFHNNNRVTDGFIGTGMVIRVKSSGGEATYTVTVRGDSSGDGKINALDLLQVQKYIIGEKKLDGLSFNAADVSGDNKVNALDLLQIQKGILGLKEI